MLVSQYLNHDKCLGLRSKVIVQIHAVTHRTNCSMWTTKMVGNKFTKFLK